MIGSVILVDKLLAQETRGIANIQYPVKELGNCKDEAACKAYCDKPKNMKACIDFAEKNNLMSKEEVERLKNEATKYAAEDKKKRENAEIKIKADQLIFQAEQALKNGGDKIAVEVKDSVIKKIENLRSIKDGIEFEKIKTATDELFTEMQKIGEAMYKKEEPKAEEKKEESTGENPAGENK